MTTIRLIARSTVIVFVCVLAGLTQGRSLAASVDPNDALGLREVLDSVEQYFPLLLAARENLAVADGARLAARGAFDTRISAGVDAEVLGFYQPVSVDVGVRQGTTVGGLELFGGYRLGHGDFAIWDKDMQTNANGELRFGINVPLLRNRVIDAQRVALWQSRLERERMEPEVATRVLEVRRDAALAFWRWVAAGEKLAIAGQLLQLAEDRQMTLRAGVEEGLMPKIALADNERLLAERLAIRIQAERSLEQAAIVLSLYLRDSTGQPRQPAASRLPRGFPPLAVHVTKSPEEATAIALAQRPELRDVALTREQLTLSLRAARNGMQPRLDLRVEASQDLGSAVSVLDDKGDFKLAAAVAFDVPVQRRKARGEVRQRQAELSRLDQQLRFQRDTISVEVRDAISAYEQAVRRIAAAERSVALARELEDAEAFQVQEGNSDLLRLNIRERQAAQASAFLVDVMQEYFEAWTRYQVVLGNASDVNRLIPGMP